LAQAATRGTILVTSGAGYVGSHACKALAAAGYQPIVYDNLCRGHRAAVRWGPLVTGDLQDTGLLTETLRTHLVAAVMHFAALANVGEAVGDPEAYYRTNVGGTLSLLSAMRDAGVARLVFSSTCAVYGIPSRVPIDETTPLMPVNPYGETKLAVEKTLNWYGEAYGLRSVTLRYFNAADASPDGDIGESHDPETHLIPLAIRAALEGAAPMHVYGTDYPTPDGTAVRDYVHSDLAEAHVSALAYLIEGGTGTALNLGTGYGHSVRAVIEAIERVSGRAVPQQHAPRRPGDPPALVADAKRAKSVLGWSPRHSDLDNIVGTALRWHTRSEASAPAGHAEQAA
jgi:UDP-glucose-4-epimerase GalE